MFLFRKNERSYSDKKVSKIIFKKIKEVLFIKNSVFRLLKYIIKCRITEEYAIILISFKVSKVYEKALLK